MHGQQNVLKKKKNCMLKTGDYLNVVLKNALWQNVPHSCLCVIVYVAFISTWTACPIF